MADWGQLPRPVPTLQGGGRWGTATGSAPVEAMPVSVPEPEQDSAVPGVVGGAAALGGLAWLASKLPGRIGKIAEGANAVRQQLMLSGMALPKSLLGNTGAAVERSLETGSMTPLKEFFSGKTIARAKQAYQQNAGLPGAQAGVHQTALSNHPLAATPGRVMGAFDDATQDALRRAGAGADEAEAAVLQRPLQGKLAEALDSPVARYIHPFRRTPFNQFIEGYDKIKNWRQNPKTMAAYTGAGAVHGAATADDETPMSIPLAIAGSARYGLPYGAAALVGRYYLGGGKDDGGVPSNVLPVSEYGFDQSIRDPLRPFRKPAALTALERLGQ